MKNTHQHWKALTLDVPVDGVDDPWIAGRKYFEITADVSKILGNREANSNIHPEGESTLPAAAGIALTLCETI